MMIPGRSFSVTNKYRYGFNGKENDNEVKGEGNLQDYGMRIYDPRLGRFLSVDPITDDYPELTPYQFSSDRPIDGVDLDGLEHASSNDQTGFIRNASDYERDMSPTYAAFKDFSAWILNNLTPFGAIDDAVVTYRDPKSTTKEQIKATIDAVTTPFVVPEAPRGGGELTIPTEGRFYEKPPLQEKATEQTATSSTNKQATQANQKNADAARSNAASNNGVNNPKVKEALVEGTTQHDNLKTKVKSKPGWKSEPVHTDPVSGKKLKPDVETPSGNLIELKPNTKSGRAKGASQQKKYEQGTGKKTRVIYYEPKKKT